MPSQPRFTREQVLAGIRCHLESTWEGSPDFDESTRLYDYFYETKNGLDDLCPLELLEELSKYFGFHWNEKRWAVWLDVYEHESSRTQNLSRRERRRQDKLKKEAWLRDVSPTFTFARLADTIARCAPAPSFAPITVFGNRCEPAGVFTGLASLPELRGKRVAPSTRLLDALGPFRVRDYLARVGWTTGVTPPRCHAYGLFGLGPADQNAATLAVSGVTFASFVEFVLAFGNIGFWGLATRASVWLIAALTVHDRLLNQIGNPLPDNVQTFGDLSRVIVAER